MDEKRIVKVNAEIVERFDNDEEIVMVKGGGWLGSLWEKIADTINIFNCTCTKNNATNCCTGGGQTKEDIKEGEA